METHIAWAAAATVWIFLQSAVEEWKHKTRGVGEDTQLVRILHILWL